MRRLFRRGRARGRPSYVLQGYVFASSAAVVAAVVLYTQNLIDRMERQSDLVSKVFARFFATATFIATEDPEIVALFDDVIQGINFPLIITDSRGIPIAWRGIGIDQYAIPYDVYRDADPDNPTPGPMNEIMGIAARFDEKHEPVPMTRPGHAKVLAVLHYGDSEFVPELRYVPLAQLGTVAILVFLGYLGYRSLKVGEQRSIWVGMAKETAHQLGTPISSVLGWLELLKDRLRETRSPGETPAGAAEGDAGGKRGDVLTILTEMERDTQRMAQVAARFETIGSRPQLHPGDVGKVAHETVEYFRLRWSRLGTQIEVREEYARVPAVRMNRDLLQWVFENLLRNAMDAVAGPQGRIEITTRYQGEKGMVEVSFGDNGRGMTPAQLRRAFDPGFTTKTRGWGLGLALAKRIVEEYHGGRMWARSRGPGKGTTFVMRFPV